jgi:acetyl esterase/lipase
VKDISPIYHPLFQYPGSAKAKGEQNKIGKLPPALFLTGTQDPVVDDNVLMSFKWSVAGAEAKVEFIAGAPHAFNMAPAEQYPIVGQGRDAIFVSSKTSWRKVRRSELHTRGLCTYNCFNQAYQISSPSKFVVFFWYQIVISRS